MRKFSYERPFKGGSIIAAPARRFAVKGLGLLIILIFLQACEGAKAPEPKVVATVGGRHITSERINDSMRVLLPEWATELTGDELVEFKNNVLGELVEEELVLGEALKVGLAVTTDELAAEEARLKESYDEAAFTKNIKERFGSVKRWREDVRRKILVRKVVGTISEGGPITDQVAQKYYKKNIAAYDVPEQVRARMILLSDEEKAGEVRKTLSAENFAVVAKEISLAPEANEGGDLGFFGKGEMPEEFEKVVFSLGAGEISEVVTTSYGHHIFLVEEHKKGRKLKFEDVRDIIKARLLQERADRDYVQWIVELKKNTKIEIVAAF